MVSVYEYYVLRTAIGYRNQKDIAEEQEVNKFSLGYLHPVQSVRDDMSLIITVAHCVVTCFV